MLIRKGESEFRISNKEYRMMKEREEENRRTIEQGISNFEVRSENTPRQTDIDVQEKTLNERQSAWGLPFLAL